MLNGALSLEEIAAAAESRNINPQPKSGRQELIENRLQRLVTSEVDSSAEAAVAFM
jgi:xylose isomerase